MKRGTIYRNLWAGCETYFVYLGDIPGRGTEKKVRGIRLTLLPDGEWKLDKKALYYRADIEHDRTHYPIVGHVDPEYIDLMVIRAIRNSMDPEIGRRAERRLREADT